MPTSSLRAQIDSADDPTAALKAMSVDELIQTKVTSVSLHPEKLVDAASAIQVISGEQIRRSGFATIPDALRLADNLNVAQKNLHDWAISARGSNANIGDKLLVLMDGRSVYTPLFSGVFWNAQDYLLEDVERIEVISGPGGTLWGANAVNGVINIATKNAKDTQGVYVDVADGSELEQYAGMRYGSALGSKAFYRVYAKYLDYDGAVLTNGSRAKDDWHQGQIGFRLDATPQPADALTWQGDFYNGGEQLQGLGLARISGGNTVGHWTHQLADDSELSAKMYFDRTHLLDPFGATSFQPAGYLIDDLDTYDLDLHHQFTLQDRHQVVWGAGFRLTADHVRREAPNLGFFPPNLTQRLYSFFGQDEVALPAPFFLTFGTKLEHNDYTGWEIEPNVRLRWDLNGMQTVWTAVSRAVRTPSRFDQDLAEPSVAPSLIHGSNKFGSETVVAEELGYRTGVNKKISASLSLFYNQYDNLRGLAPTPVSVLPLTYSNSLEAKTYGAEAAADFQLQPWWTVHAGFTRLQEDIHVKAGKSDLQSGLGETADPKNQFSVRSALDLPHRVEIDADLRYVAALLTNSFSTPGVVPSYSELNLRIGWRLGREWEFSLVGQNLLHPHHAEFGFPSPTNEELRRGVYGKAVWRY